MAIPVTSCRQLTEAGATYVLQQDITSYYPPTNFYCFQISSPSITLDGNGYSIIQELSDASDLNHGMLSIHFIL